MWQPWSASWTREHLLAPHARKALPLHVADHLLFVDIPREFGLERRWFSHVWFGEEEFVVPVLAQNFLTANPGTNQTWTAPIDWNSGSNTIEAIGGGGSGAIASGPNPGATGGGGGAYMRISNFFIANPGTASFIYNIGAGGGQISQGTGSSGSSNHTLGLPGGDTWFNSTAFPGVGSDNTKIGAKGGSGGNSSTSNGSTLSGALGGQVSAGWGQSGNNGGNAGQVHITTSRPSSGAGGAGGDVGAGQNGVDNDGTVGSTNGGYGDAGAGGAGSVANGSSASADGGAGSEWGLGHGSGGGSGSVGGNSGSSRPGAGGLYGGASGGMCCGAQNGTVTNGNGGAQGIIVITYAPFIPGLVRRRIAYVRR